MSTPTPTELENPAEQAIESAQITAAPTPSEAMKARFAEMFQEEAPIVEVTVGSNTVFEKLLKLKEPIILHQRPAPVSDALDGEALNAPGAPIPVEFSAVVAKLTDISSTSMADLKEGKTTVTVASLVFFNEIGENVEAELKQVLIPGSNKLNIRPFSGMGAASKSNDKGRTRYMLDEDEKSINRLVHTLMNEALNNEQLMHFFNNVPKSLSQQNVSVSVSSAPKTNLD